MIYFIKSEKLYLKDIGTSVVKGIQIPRGKTEIKVQRLTNHGQQNETKDKHRTHNTTLKTKLE